MWSAAAQPAPLPDDPPGTQAPHAATCKSSCQAAPRQPIAQPQPPTPAPPGSLQIAAKTSQPSFSLHPSTPRATAPLAAAEPEPERTEQPPAARPPPQTPPHASTNQSPAGKACTTACPSRAVVSAPASP